MEGFENFLSGLIHECEKTIMNLSNCEGSEESKQVLKSVQDAIKNDDIDSLNKIIKENGSIINGK